MSDCIFCKIINGEIPCAKVFENEHVLAFLDISQVTKGHTLVIPKVHKTNIYEMTPDVSREFFEAVPKIAQAIKDEYEPIGLNLLNNNGEKAGQSVFHYHMHIIPATAKETDSEPSGKHMRTTIHRKTCRTLQLPSTSTCNRDIVQGRRQLPASFFVQKNSTFIRSPGTTK